MGVAVDEPGEDQAAVQVDDLSAWAGRRQGVGVTADGDDASVADRDGLRVRPRPVDGPDATAAQDEAGQWV